MQIDKIITDYVSSKDTDYAIMIDGEWGAGKSWYWDNVLTKLIKEIPTKENTPEKPSMYKVAKISLFGVSSVDDLRIKIFEETSTIFANKYVKTGVKLTGLLLNKVASFFNVSETNANEVSEFLSGFSINLDHYVLCFDDLERIKTDLLIELLGYINTLVEQDKVKVVFICNEDELKDIDYHKYKEKIVRFTHTFKVDISNMVEVFAKDRNKSYSKYLIGKKVFIASIYQRGDCSNLRTLKYNLDIYEHIYSIIRKTIKSADKQHMNAIADYMLLLSMVYSIEYRRDNDETKLKSLSEINRQWLFQIDTLDSLSRQSNNKDNRQKSQVEKRETEKIVDYQRNIKKCYFTNSYIYGSSMPIIEYLLTGYCDDDALMANIRIIEAEAKRYETSEEKQLYQDLTRFWDTDDDVMSKAVNRTMERVREGSFLIQDYPLFFLALQSLHKNGFINLKMQISELQKMFDAAISKSKDVQPGDTLNPYYYQNEVESTPEFEALVNKVRDIYAHNNQRNLTAEFEKIVKDVNSSKNLKEYQFVHTRLFMNIGAEGFFKLFVSYHNVRKRNYWNFFNERYNSKDCFELDRGFIDGLRDRLKKYLSDASIEASGTRMYCSKILELLNKKVQQFDGHLE